MQENHRNEKDDSNIVETSRAPTWGSATPKRGEKCRPPSHGLKQSQAFQDGGIIS